MNLKDAKKHFNKAKVIECLTREKYIDVVPGTVRIALISNNIVMETKSGYFATIVDVYDKKVAKIIK